MSINRVEYNYKTFESDRDEKNTFDSMHTQSQFKLPNQQVENVKKIEVEQIRDANAIESARRQGINAKDTTSLDNDDKLFLLDCVPLAPSTKGGFSAVLLMRILDSGNLEILNNDTEGDGINFNWTLLGFSIGANFEIEDGENIGTYTVVNISATVLELQQISATVDFEGDAFIKVSYYLNDVAYVNRTNEGVTTNNILNGDNYSNLLFTPHGNLVKYYGSYLKGSSKYYPTGEIKNTFFKNNGEAEINGVKENSPILIDDLTDAIISTELIVTRCIASFETIKQLFNDLEDIKGFIRIKDTNNAMRKLYPQKLKYEWSSEVLEITGEVKQESEIVTITKSGDIITINGVGYSPDVVTVLDIQTSNDYITLYDNNSIPLIIPTYFGNVSVNGVIYDNIVILSDILLNL